MGAVNAGEGFNTSPFYANAKAEMFMRYIVPLLAAVLITGCAAAPAHSDETHHAAHDEPRPFVSEADARMAVEETMMAAKAEDKMSLIVMGANWCHDSRGLAAQFEKLRFQTLIKDHYKLLYVDVGQKDRNIDIAQDFGVEKIVGTPTVFVLSPDGEVLNLDTAPTWRNAASRSEGEIYQYFRDFAHPK